eukprot:12422205-Prorocentrum_lima.AAC.1
MSDEERAVRVDAIKAELASLDQLEVHERVNQEDVELMRSSGMNTKRLPAQLLLVKKPDRKEDDRWKAEARA